MHGKHALLIALFALTACGERAAPTLAAHTPSSQLRLESNLVQPRALTEYVGFARGGAEPDAASLARLRGTAERGVQQVRIITPAGDALREARVRSITRALRGLGVESARITADVSDYLEPDGYRLEFSLLAVEAPGCPNWQSSATTSSTNLPFSNLGCAVSSNLGQQVENPADLLAGGGSVHSDGERMGVVMQQYRSNYNWGKAGAPAAAATPAPAAGGGAAAADAASSYSATGSTGK